MAANPAYGSSEHYYGDAGKRYIQWQNESGEIAGRVNSKIFQEYCDKTKILLDFGAGAGNLLDYLPAAKKYAVEVNPSAIEILYTKEGLHVFSSLEEIPSDSIDVVVTNHVLEHIPHPIGALKEIYRVLKSDGTLVICVPIDDWRNQRDFVAGEINHHLHTWTPLLIGNTLNEAGFCKIVNIKILNNAWFPYWYHFVDFPFFSFLCRLFAIFRRRRSILAVVKK